MLCSDCLSISKSQIPKNDNNGRSSHFFLTSHSIYRQVSNIKRTLEGTEIVDHSDVVGASPVGAAPTTSSFST